MRNLIIILGLLLVVSCAKKETPQIKRYSIEQLSKNISISGGAFSDDETHLLFSGNESGIFNLYELNIQDGAQKQLTNSDKESFFAIDYVQGTDQVLYSADQEGNERDHIYLLDRDGTSRDLTPGEREKATFYGWSRDKQNMYYASNVRDPQFFDFYRMKIGEWKPVMVYENKEGLNLEDLSDDESLFVLTKSLTTSENNMYLVDRASGQMTEISRPEAPGRYASSGFNRAGTQLYYLSDADGEFTALLEYEIGSVSRKILFDTCWDVMYSALSENEKYRVIAINEDGKNNLLIIDNQTGRQVDFPQLADGDVQSVRISDSEKLMRMTVGTSQAPDNFYVSDFETGESRKLTQTLNPEINPEDLVRAELIRYPSFDGLQIPAILYRPRMASRKNKVPALVWVHGGPGGQSRVRFSSLIQFLVNHDYAILAVNNRGSSGYGKTFFQMDDRNHGEEDLKDCIWGKKWLQEQAYIDPEKIGIFGGSYGGFMVMAAMTFAPDEFKVGVNMFGVTNWLRTLKSIPPWWGAFREALYQEMGDPFSEDSVRLYDISPLFHADRVRNPIMVLQGANDPRVLQVESDEIVEAVRKSGVYVEYIIFPDEGHGFTKTENRNRGYGEILVFLDDYLKGEGPNGSEPTGAE